MNPMLMAWVGGAVELVVLKCGQKNACCIFELCFNKSVGRTYTLDEPCALHASIHARDVLNRSKAATISSLS